MTTRWQVACGAGGASGQMMCVGGGGCRRGEQVRMSTDGNAPGLAVPHRAVNSRFVRADSVIRRGEYAVNPAMGAIRQPGEYVANKRCGGCGNDCDWCCNNAR